jgi:hypothetical protein
MSKEQEHMISPDDRFAVQMSSIATDLVNLLSQKHHDYGNSYQRSLDEYGLLAAIVRMEDKFNRLKNLIKSGDDPAVQGESIKDSFIDLAGYSILTIGWIQDKEVQDGE